MLCGRQSCWPFFDDTAFMFFKFLRNVNGSSHGTVACHYWLPVLTCICRCSTRAWAVYFDSQVLDLAYPTVPPQAATVDHPATVTSKHADYYTVALSRPPRGLHHNPPKLPRALHRNTPKPPCALQHAQTATCSTKLHVDHTTRLPNRTLLSFTAQSSF